MARTHYQGVTEQAKASRHRFDDARVLLNGARWRGSMYMAGYAIECLLKTKLMRMFGCKTLSELEDELRKRDVLPADVTVYTHHLEILMGLAQAMNRIRQNRELWSDFNLVNRWVPAWRYSPDLSDSEDARDFLGAVERLTKWVDNNV